LLLLIGPPQRLAVVSAMQPGRHPEYGWVGLEARRRLRRLQVRCWLWLLKCQQRSMRACGTHRGGWEWWGRRFLTWVLHFPQSLGMPARSVTRHERGWAQPVANL